MNISRIIVIIFFSISFLYSNTIKIEATSNNVIDILPSAKVYLDKTKSKTIDDIKALDDFFETNNKKLLGFGYSPDFDVWVKFEIYNQSDKKLKQIIEYHNPLTTHISLFDGKSSEVQNEGLLNKEPTRNTLNPIFEIELEPNETKTYYMKASSYVTTLIVKLNLWDEKAFYSQEIKHQLILALFFGAMVILALYNLFIYFVVKDISYLYYVLYIFGIVLHHLIYVGMANVYLVDQQWMGYFVDYAAVFIAFPVLALALFSKTFLYIEAYPRINKILNIFIIIVFISVIVFISTDMFGKYRNLLVISLLAYLIFITVYAACKKNQQAYFILFGWSIILVSGFCMYLSSAGVFNVYLYFPYIVETGLVSEALIFSIALANKINTLQKEKVEADKKLITQQQNETARLETIVAQKTDDLKTALYEKELLLKELNHRVKNNMQTIVSLIRLQSDKITDDKIQDIFLTIQNRINAMSQLHILLYDQDDVSHIDAFEYFEIIVKELKESYNSENIDIKFDINTRLKTEEAIYCGLILNELITNSLKHAFVGQKGEINISLFQKDGEINLYISDNGVGFRENNSMDSLGLVLVSTLVEWQLKGTITINSNNGVEVEIKWISR
ncbi:MAG: 7TM diverse intracellular signaling domain-containing protein [Arcobacteraceae bacterium]|jgi:two-component sensor histidine kinase|nr:7TM diverse intracellular signaling domain-containing protein [Arcobacteraceae bacterium]